MSSHLQLPEAWHNLLHRLWSKATNHADYVKAEWMELEAILREAAELRQKSERQ